MKKKVGEPWLSHRICEKTHDLHIGNFTTALRHWVGGDDGSDAESLLSSLDRIPIGSLIKIRATVDGGTSVPHSAAKFQSVVKKEPVKEWRSDGSAEEGAWNEGRETRVEAEETVRATSTEERNLKRCRSGFWRLRSFWNNEA